MAYANNATLEYMKTRKQFGVAIASFQAAFAFPVLSPLVIVYLGCLFGLRRLGTPRRSEDWDCPRAGVSRGSGR